jgi:hypothetical protein
VLFRDSDGTYIDCLAENCTGDGFTITNLSNSALIGCRSEHNNVGFNFNSTSWGTGSGGGKLIGCSTDRNQQNGMTIASTAVQSVPLVLSGCAFRRDGRNSDLGGGGYAGLQITGYNSAVLVSGCNVFPGVNDDGTGVNSPQIGLLLNGNFGLASQIMLAGSYFQGATTGISDDNSGTTLYDGTVVAGSGLTGSQSTSQVPQNNLLVTGASTASKSPIVLTNTGSGTKPLVQVVGNAAGDTEIAVQVSGDGNQRLRIDSNGQLSWGSGAAGPDASLARLAAGVAGLPTGSFAVDSVGNGLQVKEGTNAKQGTAVLVAGSKVVANTAVTANSRILLTSNADGGTPGWLRVSARTAGTSFTITSSSGTDTSTVAYQIFEPAP